MKIRPFLILAIFGIFGLWAQEPSVATNTVQTVETPSATAPAVENTSPAVPVPETVVPEKKEEVAPAPQSKPPEVLPPPAPPTEASPVPKFGIDSVPIPEGTPYFLGARYYDKKAGGWGWIKKPNENWKQAKWVAIKETPRQYHLPHRSLKNAEADHEFQYKLLGYFADYQIYDPVRDELLDVFVIQGFESLGLQKSIERKPGPSTRFTSKKSGAYTRRNSVQSDEDGF